ncbi:MULTISPECIES: type IV secretion system protein [Snodgrassella]|uniref:type IV secretion system protein n=1 Tax=Snodgrassella TaxID=1193515 RepID=UPI000815DD5B|nr:MULTISPECIES: type IV secretion system protein [Snodgrassella]MCO6521229.1 type IV secretion system protein [Snodgrassella sp.]SCC04341.1 TrbL/VirB6 plasmid conjugal transfer protein [Snodgrassella sp. R-53583]
MALFEEMGKVFQESSTHMIGSAVSNIISAITPAVTTGVIIYFLMTGYMVLAGRISEPIGDVCIKAFKIALVAALCLSTGGIMDYVVGGINGVESMFMRAISGGMDTNIYTALDNSMGHGIDVAVEAASAADDLDIWSIGTILAFYITAIVMGIATVLMVVLGGALVMLSKIALAVILGLSPFFIVGWMFPMTAKWADAWLNQALNYALLSSIVLFILTIGITFFDHEATTLARMVSTGNSFPVKVLLHVVVISLVVLHVLKQAPEIAAGLAGGAASAGASLVGMGRGVSATVKGASNAYYGTKAKAKEGYTSVKSGGRKIAAAVSRVLNRSNSMHKS